MTKLRVLDLFSGIGGFSLGLERTGGFETVAFCEIEPYPRAVLARHWPGVPCYDDVRTLTGARLAADGLAVDVICGGFPCQDLSAAGKQAGMDGTRSGLWSEIARLVGETRPRYVIVENVSGLLSGPSEQPGGWFGRVLGDLASLGYDAEWNCIPASSIGAPHRRDRVWVVAYAQGDGQQIGGAGHKDGDAATACVVGLGSEFSGNSAGVITRNVFNVECARLERHDGREGTRGRQWRPSTDTRAGGASMAYANGEPLLRPSISWDQCNPWSFEPELGRVANGIPNRMERVKALGNAVVPQIPELIGRAILAARVDLMEATA